MSNDKITHSVSHQLKLGLAGQKLHFLVCDKNNKILIRGEKYLSDQKNLQDLLDRDEVLSGIYSKTQLMVMSPKFVVVPEQYAQHDHEYQMFKLSNKTHVDERLFRDQNVEQKEVQYSGHRNFIRLIQQKFPNIQRQHISTLFHKQIENLKREQDGLIQLYIQDSFMYLTVSQKGSMMLSNAYHITNSEDLFYFTMLAAEQLKLEPKETQLHLYQSSFKEKSLLDLFQNYFGSTVSDKQADTTLIEIWNSCE